MFSAYNSGDSCRSNGNSVRCLPLIWTAPRGTVLPPVRVVYVSQEVAYSSTCLPLPDGGNPNALPFHLLATIRLTLGTVRPVYRTGLSLLSRESSLCI